MVQMYKDLSESGLEILAYPCNQFGQQEPGTAEEINEFVRDKYKGTFPISKKVEITGKRTDPAYAFLKANAPDFEEIPWNFAKFLVDGSGKTVKFYEQGTTLEEIKPDIDALLK